MSAFQYRDFKLYQGARVLLDLAVQVQGVAVGWQIYALTGRPLDLAWVGLVQFLPALGLSLWAGHVADRVDRRRILAVCYAALAAFSLALFVVARLPGAHLGAIYLVLAGSGAARAFIGPAGQSIVPNLVPTEVFANAVAWESTLWQGAMVAGPMLGGLIYTASGAAPVYAFAAGCSLVALALVALLRPIVAPEIAEPTSLRSLFAGVRYVFESPLLLGCMSLDLFAVLLGGATALLPIFAHDILRSGPWALGLLRGAPALGAAVTGVALALRPIQRRAGAKMLAAVALFGVATVGFALSRSFPLSLAALVVVGAADMVSVVVRSSLVQLATPDAVRGRVSAVHLVFIGASSELGELESGLTAQWLGAVPSVLLGGLGTLLVVGLWAWHFTAIRDADSLQQ